MDWLNVAFLRMDKQVGRSPVLVEFWDFARINSLRTLPYLQGWHARYSDAGLRVIGVHSPGYSFGSEPENVERAVAKLGIRHPVLLDPELEVWRLYGNRGWPSRYLFDRRGTLVDVHFGEGAYQDTERAIQAALLEIDEQLDLPDPLQPIRPEDEAGAQLEPQTADISLPRELDRLELVRDWTSGQDWIEAADAGAAVIASWSGGEAWAVLSGGDLEPGLYETDGTVTAQFPGLRLHGMQFTPSPPATRE